MVNKKNIIIDVHNISKIGAHTVKLLSLENINQFRFIDNEIISHSDIGFEYTQKDVGLKRKNVLNVLGVKQKKITNNLKPTISVLFDYLTIDMDKIIQLKISKLPFVYCLLTKKYSYIFLSTNNNSPCIECFCLNEKILPKLCKKKNSNEQKEISKLQYNISNITISEIATKISYIILQIINGNKKIDENKVIKIDSNNLTVKKIFVQQNKKCGILQYSNQWIKNRQ